MMIVCRNTADLGASSIAKPRLDVVKYEDDCKRPIGIESIKVKCHHKEAPELIDRYMELMDSFVTWPLFYIWGHSSEFKTEQQWQEFEGVLKRLAETDKIWYATNGDIVRYTQAQHMLEITADEKVIYNPSVISVWIEKDKKQIVEIPAGQTVIFE